MKKVLKNVIKAGTVLTGLFYINKGIKKSSDLSIAKDKIYTSDLFYKSKHGKIRYKIEGKQNDNEKPKILLLHSLITSFIKLFIIEE